VDEVVCCVFSVLRHGDLCLAPFIKNDFLLKSTIVK